MANKVRRLETNFLQLELSALKLVGLFGRLHRDLPVPLLGEDIAAHFK
jgi:hypothetical protein